MLGRLRGSFALGFAASLSTLIACSGTGGTDGVGGDVGAGGAAAGTSAKGGAAGKAGSGTATAGSAGIGGSTGGSGGSTAGAAGSTAGAAGGSGKGGSAGTGGVAGKGGNAGVSGSSGQAGSTAGGAGQAGAGGSSAGSAGTSSSAGTGGSGPPACQPSGSASDPDQDKDGFTVAMGDCNDCDATVNPGAVDVVKLDAMGNPLPASMQVDNDCDGKVANPADFLCDDAFAVDDADPFHGANAIEICQKATGAKWGVVKVEYTQIDGQPLGSGDPQLGHGLLSAFGPNVSPRAGKRMLGLSSGTARQPSDPGYQDVGGFDKGYTSASPQGFPIESPACPGTTTGAPHDSVALRMDLKVPTNAKSFSFQFKFYTYEFPDFICSQYNDFFTVIMTPPPSDVNPMNKNITFDSMKNPISVNNAFVDVCMAQTAGGKMFSCTAGTSQLAGTGFDAASDPFGFGQDHAATSWLKTTANVTPGSTINLVFGAFDSGDGVLDSTGIVDAFQWSATAGSGTVTGKPLGKAGRVPDTAPQEPSKNRASGRPTTSCLGTPGSSRGALQQGPA